MRIFLAAFALLAAAYAGEPEEDIRAVLSMQTAAWNRGDIHRFMDGYVRSEQLRFVSGNEEKRGHGKTLARYLATYDTPEKMGTLSFKDLEVQVLGDDAAMVFGRFLLVRPEVGDATGLFTLIFRKTDEGWRIVHDHTSS
ncbi:SnoaL-like domain-containing protein [Parvularcula sp. ZS-1/3]|uniref:SnoaL-like domain-containing protein n=1 Tax=Parvularcula mediterranea TaxID=2732508 RepID=A0A7Y3W5H7_9PROT|nr:nuclear transport factor 2 family protein [Parvularcula mediterranea]NNU16327.1 SnoaL-like domain-containing protein [Parvularcula mediterranea]